MKLIKTMILVLPAYLFLSACEKRPDPTEVARNIKEASEKNAEKNADSTAPVDVDALQKKQAELEAQKAGLVSQQQNMQGQQASFALPANVNGQAFGDFMANAQALPAGIDQAKVDKVIQAAQDMDFDALQKAIADLIADVQDLIADLQAQIDDLAAQIQAAQA